MRNKSVPLIWHCKAAFGWKRFPAAFGPKGKVRPQYAQVGNTEVLYSEGHYELRLIENGKRVWRNVGDDPAKAVLEQQKAARRITAVRLVGNSDLTLAPTTDRLDLYAKAGAFVARQLTRGKNRHAVIAQRDVKQFLDVTGCRFADQLTEAHILGWYDFLRQKGNSAYTIHNKHMMIFGFLKWCGVPTKPLAPDGPPDYTENKPKIYKPEELKVLFGAMTKLYQHVVYSTLLMTGLREQEAMYLETDNFDFSKRTLTVLARDDNGFLIKDRAESTLPLPIELGEMLQGWITAHPGRYVLARSNGKVNGEWLPTLKRIARRAGLN